MIAHFIDPSAVMGPGTQVWHFAVVLADVQIGAACSIGSLAEIGRGTRIGDATRIGHGVFLPSHSQIGSRVFIGPNVTFTDDRYPRANHADYRAEPPIIEDDAAIGAGAVILPGVRIGRGARVGAGAIVTHHVPAEAIVVGMPARPVNRLATSEAWH